MKNNDDVSRELKRIFEETKKIERLYQQTGKKLSELTGKIDFDFTDTMHDITKKVFIEQESYDRIMDLTSEITSRASKLFGDWMDLEFYVELLKEEAYNVFKNKKGKRI